jgi:hypothetical protein
MEIRFRHGIPLVGMLLALSAAPLAGQRDPRARIFVERGCHECHAVVALGVKAKTDVGPDLTYAYGDVMYRYGLTLERFFQEPVSTMRFVIAGGHVRLSAADRDSIIRILRGLYGERLADAWEMP